MNPKKRGKKIQELRRSHGMTQKGLGGRIGCSESLISYVEKGEKKLNICQLQKISKIFNVEADYFLDQPAITHFRSGEIGGDQNVDYDKMIDDFLNYAQNN